MFLLIETGKSPQYDRGCKTREEFDIYKFYYRDHGELTQVQVNGVQKVLYGYENATNLLQTVTYANDDVINYYYDSNKNLISEKRNNNNAPYVTYSYNSYNELTQKINYDTGLKYVYGSNDSVTVTKLSDDSVVQTYTESSNEDQVDSEDAVVTTINESHFGTSYTSQVTNKSTTFTAGSNSVNYSFTNNDNNNIATEAVKYNNASAFTTSYSYDAKDNITSKAITLADNTTFNVVNTYDSKNRITSTGYGSAQQSYSYDQYGQLTQTVDIANGFTESYTYDSRGNILTKTKVYDDVNLPAETTSFSYGNSAWQDELTSVNGTSLTYDANGNVLTYGNMEFEWTNGRTLSQITVNPEDENGTADVYRYTYDESGIRSSKTVNGVTTYFTTKDGVILSQTDGTNTMYFQYDNSGNPTGFIYNGTQYFYLTNQMGDVIGITDAAGSLLATYTYGAWGEVLATTPATTGNSAQLAIANANPLRYRGYYLDQETGYYYLQSRYYNPIVSRFISNDILQSVLTTKADYVGTNTYVYCLNNAISFSDISGEATNKKKKGPSALVKYVINHLPKNHKNKIIDVLYKKAAGCSVYVGVQLSAKANLSEANLQSGKVKGKKKYLRIAGKYIVNVSSAGAMLKGTLNIDNNKFVACYLKGPWSEALASSIQEKYASSKYTEMYHTLYIGLQINNLTKSAAKAAVVAACVSLGHVASAAMGVIGAYVVELAPTISVRAIVRTLIPVISEQVPRICYRYVTG